MDLYAVVQDSAGILRSLGYIGADFPKTEKDPDLLQRLSDQLDSDTIFSKVDERYQSYSFQLSVMWTGATSGGDTPMRFEFQWNHERQQVQLDALDVWMPGNRMRWQSSDTPAVPSSRELAGRVEANYLQHGAARQLVADQAAIALAPLCHKGYLQDAGLGHELLVNSVLKQQLRNPGRSEMEIELYTQIPLSTYQVRIQFLYNSNNTSLELQTMSVFSPRIQLFLTERDTLPIPPATQVVRCLDEPDQLYRAILMKKYIGDGVHLRHDNQFRHSLQIRMETGKILPLAQRMRESGYFSRNKAAEELRYVSQASITLNKLYREGNIVNNQFEFQVPLTLHKGSPREVNVQLMHRLDMNTMELTAGKALVSLRRDPAAAMLVDIDQPFKAVLQQLQCRAQVHQMAEVLQKADLISGTQRFPQDVMGVLKRHQEYPLCNKSALVYVYMHHRNQQLPVYAAVHINPVSGNCRLIGMRAPGEGQALTYFPDRSQQLPHRMSVLDDMKEHKAQQEKLEWSRMLLDHEPEAKGVRKKI